jgi:hypothetical protein
MRAAAAEDANQKASSIAGEVILFVILQSDLMKSAWFFSLRAADDELSDEAFFNLLGEEGLTVLPVY